MILTKSGNWWMYFKEVLFFVYLFLRQKNGHILLSVVLCLSKLGTTLPFNFVKPEVCDKFVCKTTDKQYFVNIWETNTVRPHSKLCISSTGISLHGVSLTVTKTPHSNYSPFQNPPFCQTTTLQYHDFDTYCARHDKV